VSVLPSGPMVSGCDLIGGSPSYSNPFPSCNDGTGHSPVHLERPTFESQKVGSSADSRAAPTASLDGDVSHCHGHDSRVGRESLPE
jgi:hypothetical protein